MSEQFLWVEKYRPKKVSECILPDATKKLFEGIIRDGEIPNLIFSGSSGCGKTTVAKALCEELNVDYMFINASVDRGIDLTRTTIKRFASSVSLIDDSNRRKMVILDEADQLTNDAQPAFRAFMEEFASNCGFIFTCNFPSKIIDAIHSRCSVIDFKITDQEKKKMITDFTKRACEILKLEGVEYDTKAVVSVVANHYPDYRRTLNELYRYSRSTGKIDSGILAVSDNVDISILLNSMKSMNYDGVRNWVVENMDKDVTKIYQKIYNSLKNFMDNSNLAKAVIVLADYQYKAAFAADQELNLLACLTEIMVNCDIK